MKEKFSIWVYPGSNDDIDFTSVIKKTKARKMNEDDSAHTFVIDDRKNAEVFARTIKSVSDDICIKYRRDGKMIGEISKNKNPKEFNKFLSGGEHPWFLKGKPNMISENTIELTFESYIDMVKENKNV
jgi:hypothetical protein